MAAKRRKTGDDARREPFLDYMQSRTFKVGQSAEADLKVGTPPSRSL
jgi:hypothetical protein